MAHFTATIFIDPMPTELGPTILLSLVWLLTLCVLHIEHTSILVLRYTYGVYTYTISKL
jgi:hypothetical protein